MYSGLNSRVCHLHYSLLCVCSDKLKKSADNHYNHWTWRGNKCKAYCLHLLVDDVVVMTNQFWESYNSTVCFTGLTAKQVLLMTHGCTSPRGFSFVNSLMCFFFFFLSKAFISGWRCWHNRIPLSGLISALIMLSPNWTTVKQPGASLYIITEVFNWCEHSVWRRCHVRFIFAGSIPVGRSDWGAGT